MIKAYGADSAIEGHRFVTFGTNEGDVKMTAAKTDTVIGVSLFIGARAGETVDINHERCAEVKLGGTVARGDNLTAAADGKAVKAETGDKIAAVALYDGVENDIIAVLMK